MRRMRGTAVLLGAVLAVGAAVPVQAAATPLREFYEQRPEWRPCSFDATVECADIVVPMDYREPAGERISVAVSRIKAADPARRRGVLLSNPGGPGGEGLGLPKAFVATPLARSYDLIGFDPRGVGKSTRLRCADTVAVPRVTSRPTDAELPALADFARARERACHQAGGALRKHVSTANTARDMDVIRGVLGERKINYLGYSYGTYLGAVYGSLFPTRLDRSVLDSAVHPGWVWRDQFKHQAIATKDNVERWAEWIGKRHSTFRLGHSRVEVMATVERLATKLAATPAQGVDRTRLDAAVGAFARNRAQWPLLAGVVRKLGGEDADSTRGADAVRAVELMERAGLAANHQGVFESLLCEADWPTDINRYYADIRVFRAKYPYGNGITSVMPNPCTFRSFTPPEPLVQLTRKGYPAGLVIQADGDTQTHYDGGPALADRLSHRLITVVDEGRHALYMGNACVERHVDRYLVDGLLPSPRTTCAGAPRPNVPEDGAADDDNREWQTESLEATARKLIDERKVVGGLF